MDSDTEAGADFSSDFSGKIADHVEKEQTEAVLSFSFLQTGNPTLRV